MINFKYVRVQGREIAKFTEYPNGIFGIFRDFEKKHVLTDEDMELYQELVLYFTENLPFPPMCGGDQRVICFFKTDGPGEMDKHLQPMMWLLERYNHPYDVIYTNFPGEIIYEDEYQIVVPVESLIYKDADTMKEDMFEKMDPARRNN